jgi:hypothetical protein
MAVPAIVAGHVSAFGHKVFNDGKHKPKLLGHMDEEDFDFDHNRPVFKPYTYLRLHTRDFPWGDGMDRVSQLS